MVVIQYSSLLSLAFTQTNFPTSSFLLPAFMSFPLPLLQVTILLREVEGVSSTRFPVDDTIVDFELRLAGELFSGKLYDEAGG